MPFYLLVLTYCFLAFSHQTSLNSSGNELFWSNPTVPVTIVPNTSDLTSAQIVSIITDSMNQWNQNSVVKINSVGSSDNQISFQSNWAYGSAVLAITEVSYNTGGYISKASIFLNDNYSFKASPGLYVTPEVFLGDVVTHEIGHLFGLAHSEVLDSTMFYSSFPGQSTLASDDKAGIRQKYDHGYGKISGYIKGGNSIGVLGAHVQAISRKTGDAIGAITDENGYFVLGGLDLNDTYYLYTSPLKKVDSLPDYFANSQSQFCPGSYVGSFFSECGRENDGKPHGITLTTSMPEVDVGAISISCALRSDEDYDYQKLQSTFTPMTIYDYLNEQKSEKAFVGWFRKTTSTDWSANDYLRVDLSGFSSLSGFQKYLKISVVSYPFGTPLQFRMNVKRNSALLTASGVTANSVGTLNTNLASIIPLDSLAENNIYDLEISSKKLLTNDLFWTFPSYDQFSSTEHLPYLVIASVWQMTSSGLVPLNDTEAILSDNSSCLDAPFTYAVSKTKSSSTQSQSTDDSPAAAAGCGTIEPPNKGGPGGTLPLIVAGFLMTLLVSLSRKGRKNFLS